MKFTVLSEAIKDKHGQNSSKRIVTMSAFLMVCLAFFVDLFTPFTLSEFIFDGLMWIVVAGLGFISSENISLFKK
jgi:hypothetical protein